MLGETCTRTRKQTMSERTGTPITGAQSLISSLEAAGTKVIFGIPGGAILPAYDPLMDSTRSGTSWCATSRAPATPRRGTPRRPAGSASAWRPPVPGATNLVTPIADAHMDSVPMVAITGQVRGRSDRHGRLPGGGHPRHHDADHQAQLPRHRPGRDPADHRRGVPHRLHRPSRPGAGRHREGRAAGDDDVRLADRAGPARLPPRDPAARQADPRGRPADRSRRSARCCTSVAASSAPGASPRAARRWPSSPASRSSPR